MTSLPSRFLAVAVPLSLLVGACAGGEDTSVSEAVRVGETSAAVGKVRCEFNPYNCTVPNFEKVANKDTNRKYNDFDKTYYWELENKPELKDGVGTVRGHVKGDARFNFGQRKKIGGVSHVYAWAISLVEGGSASGWVREDAVHRVATIGKMPTAAPAKPDGGFYETDWIVTGGDIDAAGALELNAKYGDRKVNPNVKNGEAASDYLVRQWVPATKIGYVNHLYNLPGTGGMTTDTLPLCVHFKRFKAVKEIELELYFYDSASQSDLKLHFDYGEINGRRGWMTKEMLTPASEVAKLNPNHPCRVKPVPPPEPEPPPATPPKAPNGVFDGAGCTTLDGWAQDGDEPTKAIEAQLFFGPLGGAGVNVPVSANRERADLCAPLGSCNHAFAFFSPYSLFDGAPHEVHAFGVDSSDGSAAELTASGKTLSCPLPTPTGVRRWVASPEIYGAWGFDAFLDQIPLPATSADGIPEGAALPAAPELWRADGDAEVYLVDGGKRRHVTSVDSADAWHLDLDTVQIKPAAEIAAVPEGPALPVRPMLVADSQARISVMDVAEGGPTPGGAGGSAGSGAGGTGTAGASGSATGGTSAGGTSAAGGTKGVAGQGGSSAAGQGGAGGSLPAGKGGTSAGASGRAGAAGKASGASGSASGGKSGGTSADGANETAASNDEGSCSVGAVGGARELPRSGALLGLSFLVGLLGLRRQARR